MVERRAGPKNTHLLVHSLVGDAVVVGYTAPRGHPQLFENIRGILEWKVLAAPQPVCQINDDVGIASRIAGRINAPLPVNYGALGAATDSFFFFMKTARKNDVGMMGSFREKEIDDAEGFQLDRKG